MEQYRSENFGRRDKLSERLRVVGAVVVLLVFVALEMTIGRIQESRHVDSLAPHNELEWAINRYRDPTESIKIPQKGENKKRILYLSNSHARTGGYVSRHLQMLLERLAPNEYEILDLSEAGIFAPEMLQRFLASLEYGLDGVILAPAYISFSDRMKLVRQSSSTRSFFKPSIFSRLPLGFWVRNYDLGLYLDTLVSRFLRIHRYRNSIRNSWEIPLAKVLRKGPGASYVRFLEVDENQRWKFPDGFDGSLFDWSLYAIGREKHLDDLAALVRVCKEMELPTLAVNLPVHWAKDPHQVNIDDVRRYQESLKKIFSKPVEYIDYQSIFPKEFTTYDALHPTWHGARLHALDLALRMNRHHWFNTKISEEGIVDAFVSMDSAVSDEYRTMLNHDYPPLDEWSFRRYDVSEPANARDLMRRLASAPVGSDREVNILIQLSKRIRYWKEASFDYGQENEYVFGPHWSRAVESEIDKAKARTAYFEAELTRFQNERLLSFPIPDLGKAELTKQADCGRIYGIKVLAQIFLLPDGTQVEKILEDKEGRTMAYCVRPPNNRLGYIRTDILGNGSFLMLYHLTRKLFAPEWVYTDEPPAMWGT